MSERTISLFIRVNNDMNALEYTKHISQMFSGMIASDIEFSFSHKVVDGSEESSNEYSEKKSPEEKHDELVYAEALSMVERILSHYGINESTIKAILEREFRNSTSTEGVPPHE